jgi:cytochrome P450
MFAHVFAQKTIASLEPVVTEKAAVLVREIDRKAEVGKVINIRRYLNYFTIDLITELHYGESLGCLERGSDVVDAETRQGKIYRTGLIQSLHRSMSINTALGFEAPLLPYTKTLFSWHPYRRAGADFENIVYHNTMKRLRDADTGDDFFQKLIVNSRGEKLDLSMGEILAECGVIMNAGSDTTTAALTGTIFLLYKNPRVLAKLREELDPVMGNRDVPLYDSVANLPYLRACIEESLRIRPASTMGLPRVVPEGGRMIAGKFIEEGVTVSVPTYTLLRDREAFDNPDVFDPDRWINGDKERMSKAHLPFSIGPRACIGRNIAYFEQIIVIATLAHLYDFELPSEDFELGIIERFNANPDELILNCRMRKDLEH